MVDMQHSKCCERKLMRVRLSPRPPNHYFRERLLIILAEGTAHVMRIRLIDIEGAVTEIDAPRIHLRELRKGPIVVRYSFGIPIRSTFAL